VLYLVHSFKFHSAGLERGKGLGFKGHETRRFVSTSVIMSHASSSDTSDSVDTYEVEYVVDSRPLDGKTEYFIKWKNYPRYLKQINCCYHCKK
jgi:hypothetical protein